MEEEEKNKLLSLVKMLDEKDEKIFQAVEAAFLKKSSSALIYLEDALFLYKDEGVLERIKSLISKIEFQTIQTAFSAWLAQEEGDLMDVFFILSQCLEPNLNKEECLKKLQVIRMRLWLELNETMSLLEQVLAVNTIFFEHMKFNAYSLVAGLKVKKSDLNIESILNYKRGTCLSLGILYQWLLAKLGIGLKAAKINGINFFGLFDDQDQLIFGVNPIQGDLFSKIEILAVEEYKQGESLELKKIENNYSFYTKKSYLLAYLCQLKIYFSSIKDEQRLEQIKLLLKMAEY